jgi:hypothetical protein
MRGGTLHHEMRWHVGHSTGMHRVSPASPCSPCWLAMILLYEGGSYGTILCRGCRSWHAPSGLAALSRAYMMSQPLQCFSQNH